MIELLQVPLWDAGSQYPIERLEDAVWVLFERITVEGTTVAINPEELYSLQFGGPRFLNNGQVKGFRRCNALSAMSDGLVASSTLISNDYSTDGAYCGEDQYLDVDQLFDSIFLSHTAYIIENNVLTITLPSAESLCFEPRFDARLLNEIITILDDSTLRVRFEEYLWLDFDFGVIGENSFILSSEMLTDEIKAFIDTMQSTPIYVSHNCPDNTMPLSGESFFWIFTEQDDANSYTHGAGITCGLSLIGGRRFLRSDVLALKSMLEGL